MAVIFALADEPPFGARAARMLMTVAGDERLANPNHGSDLPNAWRTLYEARRLDRHASLEQHAVLDPGRLHRALDVHDAGVSAPIT